MLYRFYESGYTAIHMHRQGTTTHPTDSGATGRNDTESWKFEAQEGVAVGEKVRGGCREEQWGIAESGQSEGSVVGMMKAEQCKARWKEGGRGVGEGEHHSR